MGLPRSYVSLITPEVEITGTDAHHLTNVLRLGEGDRIAVFDGQSCAEASVVAVSRSSIRVAVDATTLTVANPIPPLTVLMPVPRQERARFLVEKLTELGVTALVPLMTEYSASTGRPIRPDKLRRFVIEACKQCGRDCLMTIEEPRHLEDCREDSLGSHDMMVLADPAGDVPERALPTRHIRVFVGPEGGFTENELQFIRQLGAVPTSFGRYTLRMETAAIAAAAAFNVR